MDWKEVASQSVSARNWQPTIDRFRGDPKLAASYLPFAQSLLGDLDHRLVLGGIAQGARLVKLADGTVIRVVVNGAVKIIEIDARGADYSGAIKYRSFIFIPKQGVDYLHAKAPALPYDVNAVVEDGALYYYRYTYENVSKSTTVADCTAEVFVHPALEGYGNQNSVAGNTIFSWWHSTTGDLPIINIQTADYRFLAGNTAFLVYKRSRRTVEVTANEKLPCYTHAMVNVKYVDDNTGVLDDVETFEFGYFVATSDYYYFYKQPPVCYKNNRLYPIVLPDETQLILGLSITKDRETVVTLQNPLKILGPVFVTVTVQSAGGWITGNLASLLDVTAIFNNVSYPVRFSPDGSKFAGLFYTLVDDVVGFALILGEFRINDDGFSMLRREIQTYQYTVSSTTTRTSGAPEVLNDYTYINSTYNNQVTNPADNCNPGKYTTGAYQIKTTLTGRSGTLTTATASEITQMTTIGEPTIAVNYNESGGLVRCTLDMHFITTITNAANEKSGSVIDYSHSTRNAQTVPPLSAPNPPTNYPPIYEDRWQNVTGWPNCTGVIGYLTKINVNNYRTLSANSNYLSYDYASIAVIEKFNLKTSDSTINFSLGSGETAITASGESNISTGSRRVYEVKGLLSGGVYSRNDTTLGPYSNKNKIHYRITSIDGTGTWGNESTTYQKEFTQQAVELTHLNLAAKVFAYTNSEDSCTINITSTRQVDVVTGYGSRTEQHYEWDNVKGTTIDTYTSTSDTYTVGEPTQTTTGSLTGASRKQSNIIEYGALETTKLLDESDEANVNRTFTNSTTPHTLLSYAIDAVHSYTVSYEINVSAGLVRNILANSTAASLCSDPRNSRPLYLYSTYRKNWFTTYGNDHYLGLFDNPVASNIAELQAIDTNLPPRYGVAQLPVNPPPSGIGDHLCPIGLLRALYVKKPKRYRD